MGPHPPCIFCGAPADSIEDVIPKWLHRRYRAEQTCADLKVRRSPKRTVKQATQTMAIVGISDAVCIGCNGSWMSQMEERSKPLIVALYEGQQRTLDQAEQERLAAWAILKHFVWQTGRRQPHAATVAARHHLRDNQEPMAGATVAYATYGPGNLLHIQGSHLPGPSGPVEATGLVLGFGMLRVISFPSAVNRPNTKMGRADDHEACLFPIRPGGVDVPRRRHHERDTRPDFLGPER